MTINQKQTLTPAQARRNRRNKALPLPTPEEHNAMVGDVFYKDSTGAGLEQLAQSGRRKIDAIEKANSAQVGQGLFASDVKLNTLPRLPLRTPQENDAVTGFTLYGESTGKGLEEAAKQVLAREKIFTLNAQRQQRLDAGAAKATHVINNQPEGILNDTVKKGIDWVSKQANEAADWANSKLGIARHNLMDGPIDDSTEAVARYFFGDGTAQALGVKAQREIILNYDTVQQMNRLINGTAPDPAFVDINAEDDKKWSTFHVGDTVVKYNEQCTNGTCIATITAPFYGDSDKDGVIDNAPDRFQDPIGLGFELPIGKPFDYKPFEWQIQYPDPRKRSTGP